jgi:penicillin-binding protein 2
MRLRLLWCGFALLAAVIMGRLVHLQVMIADRFLVDEPTTFETFETIPSRDGRILTSDGRVLAFDAVRYDVELEYRWLEEPPNPLWLSREARELVSQSTGTMLEEAAREHVLNLRNELWRRLAGGAGMSDEEFAEVRQRIQNRVERIRQSVLDRREARESAEVEDLSFVEGENWWERGWRGVVHELTTPPQRAGANDPLIIVEELEHHAVLEGVTLDLISQIELQPEMFPGTRIRTSTTREYPEHSLASHIVGIRTPWTAENEADAVEQHHGGPAAEGAPAVGDRVGRSGIEASYDTVLRGRPGLRRIVRDEDGKIIHDEVVREVVHGVDVILSVDAALQERCEALLAAALTPAIAAETAATEELPEEATTPTGGCIVAIDVRNGQVLAAASAPTYDLNQLIDPDPETWQALNKDPRQPFFSRATQMTAPPGSVFKILTAIAALESGMIESDTLIHCQGYLDDPDSHRCYLYRQFGGRHGDLDVTDALCRSCNVFFFVAARQLGPEPLVDWARRFGFGEPAGLDLRDDPGGHLPMPPSYARRTGHDSDANDERWYPGTTLQVAIGQASLTVSPLQAARMVAAVANGGWLVTPRLVERVDDTSAGPESSMVQLASAITAGDQAHRIEGLSEETLDVIRQGLREVVSSPYGTGHTAEIDDIPIAGKTGTAEVGGGLPDHAWFAGYAPANEPKVAFVVMLEHGGSGGRAAGPLARELVLALREFGHISE